MDGWRPKDPPRGSDSSNGKDPTDPGYARGRDDERPVNPFARREVTPEDLRDDLTEAGAFGKTRRDDYAEIDRLDPSGKKRTAHEMRKRAEHDAAGISQPMLSPAIRRQSREAVVDRSHMNDKPPPPTGVSNEELAKSFLTPEQEAEYLRALAIKKDPLATAHSVGLDPQILREYRERSPEFTKLCEQALGNERRYVQYMRSQDWRIRPAAGIDGKVKRPAIDVTRKHLGPIMASLAEHGNLAIAAQTVGSSLGKLRKAMERDEEIKNCVEEAMMLFAATLEIEAKRRAVEGYLVPVFGGRFKDEVVGYERRYSEGLLKMLLRKADPAYQEKKSVEVSKTLTIKGQIDFAQVPKDDRQKLKEMLRKMKEAKGELPSGEGQEVGEQVQDAELVEDDDGEGEG